jgi:hypothetical protein
VAILDPTSSASPPEEERLACRHPVLKESPEQGGVEIQQGYLSSTWVTFTHPPSLLDVLEFSAGRLDLMRLPKHLLNAQSPHFCINWSSSCNSFSTAFPFV